MKRECIPEQELAAVEKLRINKIQNNEMLESIQTSEACSFAFRLLLFNSTVFNPETISPVLFLQFPHPHKKELFLYSYRLSSNST